MAVVVAPSYSKRFRSFNYLGGYASGGPPPSRTIPSPSLGRVCCPRGNFAFHARWGLPEAVRGGLDPVRCRRRSHPGRSAAASLSAVFSSGKIVLVALPGTLARILGVEAPAPLRASPAPPVEALDSLMTHTPCGRSRDARKMWSRGIYPPLGYGALRAMML